MGSVQGARQVGKTTLVEHGGAHPYVEKSTLKDGAGLYGGFANGEYRLLTEKPGFVELEPDSYFQAILDGARKAIANAKINATDIVAISCLPDGK